MKILVYGINYSPELTGIGKYTGEMVEWMASQGHDVRVITAPPYYPEWKVGERYSSWRYRREEGAATVWRCPLYVPKQPSTLKRLIHLGSFALSSFFPLMAQRRWKPDRIIGVVPTLFCTPGMRLLGKLSGARTLLHIQDYEVDAMLGLGMAGKGKGGKVAKLASAFERSGLHNVDYVSTISRSMMNKAQEKGVAPEKVIFFPNWSEVARFRDVTEHDAQALRAELGLPDDQKIILYSGNIGEKQGLESVIDAAQQSPVYKMAMDWKLALPLHPEYRTLPMVWYVPPLSPIQSAADAGELGSNGILPDVESLRIPVQYLANLLTAGDTQPVLLALKRMLAMRHYKRAETVDGVVDTRALEEVGLSEAQAQEMYRYLAIANYEDRFVVPSSHREQAREAFPEKNGCGFSFGDGCHGSDSQFNLFNSRRIDAIDVTSKTEPHA